MKDNSVYQSLGKYIQLSKEKNTQLLATRHFGLSASEGLVELPLEKGKADKSSFWILREGQIAIDLINSGSARELVTGRHFEEEIAMISDGTYTVFSVTNNSLNVEYLSLILKSQKTKKILLHYACHGVKMVLPWEDFCNLPIRVPLPSQQEELVKKYSIVERTIKLKREINETLEKWMECYYHILFDNLSEEQLEQKQLGDLLTIVGGGTPSRKCPEYFCEEGGIPWVKIQDLIKHKGKFIERGLENITEIGFNETKCRILPRETILLAKTGYSKQLAISLSELCTSPDLIELINKKSQYDFWIWFTLKKEINKIFLLFHGTSILHLRNSDLKNYWINVPSSELLSKFIKIVIPFFQLQKTNEREIGELVKLQKYFIELTN